MANPYGLNFGQTYGRPVTEALGGTFTPAKAKFFNAWGLAEGTKAQNNPFATTREDAAYGAPSYFNRLGTGGVQNYRDLSTGIRATVDTLNNGHYDNIVSLLRNPNATAVDLAKAVAASPWGTGMGVLRALGASTSELESASSANVQKAAVLTASQTQIQDVNRQQALQPSAAYLNIMKSLGGAPAFIAGLSERLHTTPFLPAAATVATTPEGRAQSWGGSTQANSKMFKPTGNGTVDSIINIANQQIGKPYVWGAESPDVGFDCSGLIEYAFEQAGVQTPGRLTTWSMAKMGRSVKNGPYKPGDWIITNGGKHVVMYVGGGQVIAAPHTGEVVQYQPLSRFDGDIVDVRRVLETKGKKKGKK